MSHPAADVLVATFHDWGTDTVVGLHAVRSADADTLIVADGFSYREPIAQTTNPHALHGAELLQLGSRARGGQ